MGTAWISALAASAIGGSALLAIYIFTLRRLRVTELDDALMPLIRRR
jgi:hypothetical protein